MALDSIDLTLAVGRTHGLLGPNGAGKTTLCKILSTVLLPSSGEVRLFGKDVVRSATELRPLIGIAFGGDRGLYGRLSVEQNLEYWAALYGMGRKRARQRVDASIDAFGLRGRSRERVEVLSRGWKQRVHLARATLHEPQLLILDEPTSGLDPVASQAVRELVAHRLPEQSTVLISTHDMREAERLCDRVTVVGDGRVLAEGTPGELAMSSRAPRVISLARLPGEIVAELRELDAEVADAPGGMSDVRCTTEASLRAALDLLLARGLSAFGVQSGSLESFYLELLGERGIGE